MGTSPHLVHNVKEGDALRGWLAAVYPLAQCCIGREVGAHEVGVDNHPFLGHLHAHFKESDSGMGPCTCNWQLVGLATKAGINLTHTSLSGNTSQADPF